MDLWSAGLMVPNTFVLLAALQTAAEESEPDPGGFDFVGPIAGTGIVGIILLMVIFRLKIMPTYVFDEAKADWERERAELKADIDGLKLGLAEQNEYMRTQVVPTMTRVLDAERELVDLRREEQADRRRRET